MDKIQKLTELQKLRDSGMVTDAEFEALKREIIIGQKDEAKAGTPHQSLSEAGRQFVELEKSKFKFKAYMQIVGVIIAIVFVLFMMSQMCSMQNRPPFERGLPPGWHP